MNPILEDNLSRLLKRAYEPAPCRQEFREACLQRILRIVGRPPGRLNLSLLAKIAIAAGVLFIIGFVTWRGGVFDGSGGKNNLPGVSDGMVATPGGLLTNSQKEKKHPSAGTESAASQPREAPQTNTIPVEKSGGADSRHK